MSFLLLHWNARSLISNGQGFKKHIVEMGKLTEKLEEVEGVQHLLKRALHIKEYSQVIV